MKEVNYYLDKLYEIHSNKGIHQATIDLVEGLIEDFEWLKDGHEYPVNTEAMIGDASYNVHNFIEICDMRTKDYPVLVELYNLFNES